LTRTAAGGKITAPEVWTHRLMRVHHCDVVRIGEAVYGECGDSGPTPLAAVDMKTGRLL